MVLPFVMRVGDIVSIRARRTIVDITLSTSAGGGSTSGRSFSISVTSSGIPSRRVQWISSSCYSPYRELVAELLSCRIESRFHRLHRDTERRGDLVIGQVREVAKRHDLPVVEREVSVAPLERPADAGRVPPGRHRQRRVDPARPAPMGVWREARSSTRS